MAFTAPQLYREFEGTIDTMDDLDEMMDELQAEQRRDEDKKRVFAYRGVANADYAFFSSLYRRLWWTDAIAAKKSLGQQKPPAEKTFAAAEDRVLTELHHWGLHDAERGRLSILRQLAVLQHNHAPTRLIDVSLNIWVALWFAVERQWADGEPEIDAIDGRLFAIDITDRLINEQDELRDWEDLLHRPWSNPPDDWTRRTFAWQPSPADRRIAAQQGAFLFGGVPAGRFRKSTKHNDWLHVDDLRRCTSLALQFHKAGTALGRPANNATYTYRIAASLKEEIRRRLLDLLGLSAGRIYPDLPGFGKFGTPWLVDGPVRA